MLFEQRLIDQLITVQQLLDADNLPEIVIRAVQNLMEAERTILLFGDGAVLSDGHRNLGVQFSSHPFDQLQLSRTVLEMAMEAPDGVSLLNEEINRTESMSAHGIRSCIAGVVRIGSQNIGAIYCDVRQSGRRFAAEDCMQLKKIAVVFAATFERIAEANQPGRSLDDEGILSLEDLAGCSEHIRELRKSIEQVARLNHSVLIIGPTGSGKELVARLLHRVGRRKGKLVALNCGETTDSLVASELFGHVKGAFTDAHVTRTGMIVEADRGTLFLDEIANASMEFQAKLLRVLETCEVRPVGSSLPAQKVDVRFIFATNRDLEQAIAAKKFMLDLYYRISQIQLRTAALSQRPEDIPELARRFGRPLSIDPRAVTRLVESEWPGNVRQLKAAVEVARDMASGSSITIEDVEAASRLAARHNTDEPSSIARQIETGSMNFFSLRVAAEERRISRDQLARVLQVLYEREGSWAAVGRKLQLRSKEDLKRFDNFVQNLKKQKQR